MHLFRAFAVATLAALALVGRAQQPDAWEKLVLPGVTYRMEVDRTAPRTVYALRLSPGAAGLQIRSTLADGTIWSEDEDQGRETLTRAFERTGAFAGVNADFFNWNGDMIGAMIVDGELVSLPFAGRAVFAWAEGFAQTGTLRSELTATGPDGRRLSIGGLNEECGDNGMVLSTSIATASISSAPANHYIFTGASPLRPNDRQTLTLARVVTEATRVPVAAGEAAIVAMGESAPALAGLEVGDSLTLTVATTGMDVARATDAIAGGPVLVRDGEVAVAWQAEGFTSGFATDRHPRTALGVTAAGDLWLVVIDGRQSHSIGASLEETARVMQRLGCVEAINLDGGGSSALGLGGMVVNRPSGGEERPVANFILAFSTAYADLDEAPEFAIKGPARVTANGTASYVLIGEDGQEVPSAEVVWACQGAAWVDESGTVTGLEAGEAILSAWSAGRVVTLRLKVE